MHAVPFWSSEKWLEDPSARSDIRSLSTVRRSASLHDLDEFVVPPLTDDLLPILACVLAWPIGHVVLIHALENVAVGVAEHSRPVFLVLHKLPIELDPGAGARGKVIEVDAGAAFVVDAILVVQSPCAIELPVYPLA